jgi:hypothetical protein
LPLLTPADIAQHSPYVPHHLVICVVPASIHLAECALECGHGAYTFDSAKTFITRAESANTQGYGFTAKAVA